MPIKSVRRYIGISDVKSGMMVQFKYTKRSGGGGEYTVLVIDPKRKNDHASEDQLHGFTIDNMSDSELTKFFSSFGEEFDVNREDKRASVVEELNTDEAYDTFVNSQYVTDRSYRTFNHSGISKVRQILLGDTSGKRK